jgi:hypothetical protein
METRCVLFQSCSEFLHLIYTIGAVESANEQEMFIIY